MIRLGYPKRMEDRRIGSLSVSAVGLGCNNFGWGLDAATTSGVVESALEAGMTFFDTADVYGQTNSERFLGQALQGRRQNVVVATKFGADLGDGRKGAKPDYVRQAVEDSLRRLGTDYIDLYQLHMPDSEVPIDETLGVLHDLVQAGKVREVGCSNFSAAQLRTARDAVPEDHARFASVARKRLRQRMISRLGRPSAVRRSTSLRVGEWYRIRTMTARWSAALACR